MAHAQLLMTWPMKKLLNLKTLSLVSLSIQTSAMVLILRYSRTARQPYLISTAVLFSEVLKLIVSSCLLLVESGWMLSMLQEKLVKEVFVLSSAARLFIPAALYVVQNNLLFIALTNLDAATYQVTYQLKILTTAIFSWIILGKKLGFTHWASLMLLMIGVSLVQVEDTSIIAKAEEGETLPTGRAKRDLDKDCKFEGDKDTDCDIETSWLLGICVVLISCIISGFSGVYFEKILKSGARASLVVRNLQLGMFSVVLSFVAVYGDRRAIERDGFFQGYATSTWAVIAMQALSGLLVSLTMKYADNILKGFATSLSIVMSAFVSWLILGDKGPSLQYALGASVVIGATFMYSISSMPTSEGLQKKLQQEQLLNEETPENSKRL